MNPKRMSSDFISIPLALKWVGIIGSTWAGLLILGAVLAYLPAHAGDLGMAGRAGFHCLDAGTGSRPWEGDYDKRLNRGIDQKDGKMLLAGLVSIACLPDQVLRAETISRLE